ncbi:uncharacterized protein BDZ99DRAFT_522901 [Mytilinidion resinicola]|uniref:Uncharacterized protein n=1 Tax=Mytilinidion resinicola TaxID=574789 RepID=A0A6A6YEN1_9PEZI|nr:uncharacterized protein BDZ99DRAFT_522901 [Mytilinidion resinicola]KAF2807286.1 hypothetical protein BDZ99DRAFT_522901 [Mytilinidion resinicola]
MLVLNSGAAIAALTAYRDSVPNNAAFAAIHDIHFGGHDILYRWLDQGSAWGPGPRNPDFALLARCPQLASVTFDISTCIYQHLVEMFVDEWFIVRGHIEMIEKLDLGWLGVPYFMWDVLAHGRPYAQRIDSDEHVPKDLMTWIQGKFAEPGLRVTVVAEAKQDDD